MRVFIRGIGSLILLSAILLASVEVLGILARQFGHQVFHGVDPTVAAAGVTAMSTVIVTVASLITTRYIERRRAIESEIREKKIPIYSRMVGGLLRILLQQNSADQREAAEVFFRELTPDLITWASDDVLTAWSRFRRDIVNQPSEDVVFTFEKVLMAIRKDYGHGGANVKEGDLLGLFINDIDEQLARRRLSAGPENTHQPSRQGGS